jgi:hypothetical protein
MPLGGSEADDDSTGIDESTFGSIVVADSSGISGKVLLSRGPVITTSLGPAEDMLDELPKLTLPESRVEETLSTLS